MEFATIPEMLALQAKVRPDQPAVIAPDSETFTYADLHGHVMRLGRALQTLPARDAARGLRVGIALPNGLEISVVLLAAACAGTAVPFNPALTAAECETLFAETGIDMLVVPAGADVGGIAAAQALGVPVLRLGAGLRISGLRAGARDIAQVQPDGIAMLLLTSGSTGRPKRVPLSHRNVCCAAQAVVRSVDLSPDDCCLVMWEQFHIGGLVDLLLAPLASGGRLVAAGSYDSDRFFEMARVHQPTWYQAVPTTLAELVFHGERNGLPAPRLRFVRAVAAALSPAVQEQAEGYFEAPVVRTLGMTEAGPLITSTALPPAPQKPGSVGQSAGPEVQIQGPDGVAVAQGQAGQVAIRGDNVFAGYEDDPDANATAFRGGWFLTGDVGYLDPDGDLFLTGRIKEQINRGGEKISPQEVDDALLSHPDVIEAATFAARHATLGEDIVAAVALASDVTDADLRSFLGARLAAYKIPARIIKMQRLPRNPVGKIDRMALAHSADIAAGSTAVFVAPATPNEKTVAEIWCHELRLNEISVHQDFAGADGDSLSAVRILVALEARYGKSLPDDLLHIASTVHQMAAVLDAQGITPPAGAAQAASEGQTVTHAALAEAGVFAGDPVAAVAGTRSRHELRLVLDFLIAHATPAQTRRIVAQLRGAKVGQAVGVGMKLILTLVLAKWRWATRRDLKSSGVAETWTREAVVKDALLFSDPGAAHEGKTLIVGFAGDRTRLLMPTYQALAGLDPKGADLLLLIDRSQRLFLNGMPDVGDDLAAIARFLRHFADDRGYGRVVGLGTSAGSLAVLAVSVDAGFDLAISAAPAGLKKHAGFAKAFKALRKQGDLPPMRIIHADRAQDTAKAAQLKHAFPEAEMIVFGKDTKNVMRTAYETGNIRSVFAAWLAPGPANGTDAERR